MGNTPGVRWWVELSKERGSGQQRSFVYDRGGEDALANSGKQVEASTGLQIPDGGGAKAVASGNGWRNW
jgi:hypothetical protein